MSWWALAGAVIGGLGAASSAKKSFNQQQQAINQAWDRGQPGAYQGMFGGSSYDPDTKTWTETLSPEMQDLYDRYGISSGKAADELEAMGTGEEAQMKLYNEQRSLFAPQEMRQRLGVENRLRSQNRLATTGGSQAMGDFDYGMQMKDYSRQVGAFDQSQNLMDKLRARRDQDVQGMFSIGQLPQDYTKMSMTQGKISGDLARQLAGMKTGAIKDKYDAYASGWGGLGSAVGGMGGGSTSFGGAGQGRNFWGDLWGNNPNVGGGYGYKDAMGLYGGPPTRLYTQS